MSVCTGVCVSRVLLTVTTSIQIVIQHRFYLSSPRLCLKVQSRQILESCKMCADDFDIFDWLIVVIFRLRFCICLRALLTYPTHQENPYCNVIRVNLLSFFSFSLAMKGHWRNLPKCTFHKRLSENISHAQERLLVDFPGSTLLLQGL